MVATIPARFIHYVEETKQRHVNVSGRKVTRIGSNAQNALLSVNREEKQILGFRVIIMITIFQAASNFLR